MLLTSILGHQIHRSQRFGRRFRAQEKRPGAGGGGRGPGGLPGREKQQLSTAPGPPTSEGPSGASPLPLPGEGLESGRLWGSRGRQQGWLQPTRSRVWGWLHDRGRSRPEEPPGALLLSKPPRH